MTARDLRQVRADLVETFVETGCRDDTAQRAADEVIAEIRALVAAEVRAAALAEAADLVRGHLNSKHNPDDCAACAMVAAIADDLRRMAGQEPTG